MMWRPIRSAPRDGSVFIGYAQKQRLKGQVVIFWSGFYNEFCESVTGTPIKYLKFWTPLLDVPRLSQSRLHRRLR